MLAVPSVLHIEGIRKILASKKDIKIVAETLDYLEVIPLIEQNKPDVLFIDTAIAYLDIVKILELIEKKSIETKVVLLLHTLDEEVIINIISLGVHGCLTDESNSKQFIQAVRTVSKGKTWVGKKFVTRSLLLRMDKSVLKPKFTKREKEIIKFIMQGYSNKQIAKKLFISQDTVKSRLKNIFKKLNVRSRFQLVIKLLGKNISSLFWY